MKKYILLLLLFLISFSGFSQQKKLLKNVKVLLFNDSITTNLQLNKHNFLLEKQLKKIKLDHVLKKKHSFFIVYTHNIDAGSSNLLKLKSNNLKLLINTDLTTNNTKTIESNDLESNILSIRMLKPKLKGGDIIIDKEFINKNKIYEIIYFPKWLNNKIKRQIETYLSVKYGISLQTKIDYYDSSNKKIWDAKVNKEYSNRVFGIGKDTGTGLLQYESRNVYSSLLQISFTNSNNVSDKEYVLVGDNGKKAKFVDAKNISLDAIMDRKWKISATQTYPLDFVLQVNESQKSNNYDYWLMLSNKDFEIEYSKFVKAKKTKQGKYFFNSVKFEEREYFTFVRTEKNHYPGTLISFYPNPVVKDDALHIHFIIPDKQKIEIKIYNEAGQLLISENKIIENRQELTYKLPQTGIYFIKIAIDNHHQTAKIICE